MANIAPLRNSLILLVHLHLLTYPYANNPEYDDQLFSSKRGLRERTKALEDISYFLVGRLERMKDRPKALFPTYPCSKPSDTVAFRTSLVKYLEQLRHGSIYSASSGPGSKLKDRQRLPNGSSAEWWKDVVIRKSLLEECIGERFERLILALSTHTLMKLSKSPPVSDLTQELIRQPLRYHSELSRLSLLRQHWKQKASHLNQRKDEVDRVRVRLQGDRTDRKFKAYSTQRLKELAQSKENHLKETCWQGEDGRKSLELMLALAGLSKSATCPPAQTIGSLQKLSVTLLPLPLAAAHHPSQLKKIRRPVFPAVAGPHANVTHDTITPNPDFLHTQPYIQAEASAHSSLKESLARLRLENERLSRKFTELVSASSEIPLSPLPDCLVPFDSNILDRLTSSVAAELGTLDPAMQLETRIEEIRAEVLPPYPIIQDPLPPRLPALEPKIKHSTGIPLRVPTHHPATASGKVSEGSAPMKGDHRKSSTTARNATQRVSTLRLFSGGEEVNLLIDSTNDLPSDGDDSGTEFASFGTPRHGKGLKTPKSKPKIHRIWTASTPGERPPSTLRNSGLTSRESFPDFMEAAVSLPSLLSTEGFLGDDDGDEYDGCEKGEDIQHGRGMADELETPRAKSFDVTRSSADGASVGGIKVEQPEEEYEEEESMTLKDMLLSSQAKYVDLFGSPTMQLIDRKHMEEEPL